jgi:hypothetical protein
MATDIVMKPPTTSREIRRHLTLAKVDEILRCPELRKAWPREVVAAERKRLEVERRRLFGGESPGQPGHEATFVCGTTCSHAWAEAVWHDGTAYPPGKADTKMVTCKACGTPTPPNNVGSSGACDDCRLGSMSDEALERLGPGSPAMILMSDLPRSERDGGIALDAGLTIHRTPRQRVYDKRRPGGRLRGTSD